MGTTDQRYLRVRNTSTDQLYLSDLDDEENHEENKGVQVYIDAREYADLPLDGDVLHSFEQGTIRGFINDKKMEASPFEANQRELWVSPEGHDDNPGTYHAPIKHIQTAVNRLDSQFGVFELKTVRLKVSGKDRQSRLFKGPVFINSGSWRIIGEVLGEEQRGTRPVIYIDSNDQYNGVEPTTTSDGSIPFVVTNMTRSSWDQYINDGGISYTANSSFSYDGASLENRNTSDKFKVFTNNNETLIRLNVYVENVEFSLRSTPGDSVGFAVVPAKLTNDRTYFQGIEFNSVGVIYNSDTYGYIKNTMAPCLRRFGGHGDENELIMDNIGAAQLTSHRVDQPDSFELIVNLDNTLNNGNIRSGYTRLFEDGGMDPSVAFKGFRMYADWSSSGVVNLHDVAVVRSRHRKIGVYGTASLSAGAGKGEGRDFLETVACGHHNIELDSSELAAVDRLLAKGISKTGTGDMILNSADIEGNGITIEAGTLNEIRGGVSKGDIQVKGGASFDFSNITAKKDVVLEGGSEGLLKSLHIEGDLLLRDANTTVRLEGCHIEGNIDIEDHSGVDVTMNGGSYMGSLTDPGGHFTRNTGN